MMDIEAVEADLQEIEEFLKQSKRLAVRGHLEVLKKNLELRLADEKKREAQHHATETAAAAASASTSATDAAVPAVTSPQKIVFKPVSSYGWDQEGRDVTVYITGLAGVGDLPKERVAVEFKEEAFDVKVLDLSGVNWRMLIPDLHDKIEPHNCRYRVRGDKIIVTLKKLKSGHWTKLTADTAKKTAAAMDKDDDPSKGIMNLMQQMYDDGDEEMKRTIAKAWSESRQKQGMI